MNAYILYFILLTGVLFIFVPPIVAISKTEKFQREQFVLNVSLPVLVGLLIYLVASAMLMKDADDAFFYTIIPVTAISGIAVSAIYMLNTTAIMLYSTPDK
jgi:hypothetical protein